MATGVPRIVEKTRLVEETYKEEDGVILHLTDDEAAFLAAILGMKVVGDNNDIRSINRGIWKVLKDHSYDFFDSQKTKNFVAKMQGSVVVNG